MASLWTSAITSAWSVVGDLMGDFLPVLGVGLGIAIFGGLWAAFGRKDG